MKIFRQLILILWFLCSTMKGAEMYSVYPILQEQQMTSGSLVLTPAIDIVCHTEVDEATRQRAHQVLTEAGYSCRFVQKASSRKTSLQLMVDASVARSGKYDSYTLVVGTDGICIVGQHTNAVFYALATLEQMLEQREVTTGSPLGVKPGNVRHGLPCVRIADYADLKNRGVVEGYYGFPYSVSVRKDLIRFMMRYKMNTYLYGGKSDPFHSRYWQQPYPPEITAAEQQEGWMCQSQISDLAQLATATKVNFIWAIHPGDSFVDSETVVEDIIEKFDMMHQLGVRQFALFVDDVFIPTEQADIDITAERVTALQQAIERRWNQPGTAAQDSVRPLHFVPQIYCSGFADSDEQRLRFMHAMGRTPENVTIYTTGQWVWTVPNCEHTSQVRHESGRPMAWWWNYPCNDNADSQIYPMDMYGNFADMPAVRSDATLPASLTDNIGLLANPMQQGEVSKTPLFSVANYAWNNAAYDNHRSWEASFAAIVRDTLAQQSYRYLADFLRWNDPEYLGRMIGSYRQSIHNHEVPDGTRLREALLVLEAHCNVMERLQTSVHESDRLLYDDLRPWLKMLRAQCITTRTLMDEVESRLRGDEVQSKSVELIRDLANNTDYTVTSLEGMGESITTGQRQAQTAQRYLAPFIDFLLRQSIAL